MTCTPAPLSLPAPDYSPSLPNRRSLAAPPHALCRSEVPSSPVPQTTQILPGIQIGVSLHTALVCCTTKKRTCAGSQGRQVISPDCDRTVSCQVTSLHPHHILQPCPHRSAPVHCLLSLAFQGVAASLLYSLYSTSPIKFPSYYYSLI